MLEKGTFIIDLLVYTYTQTEINCRDLLITFRIIIPLFPKPLNKFYNCNGKEKK